MGEGIAHKGATCIERCGDREHDCGTGLRRRDNAGRFL